MKYKFKISQTYKFKVWSNIFFLIPLILSIAGSLYWYSTVIGLMLVLSLNYHYYNEAKYYYRDCVVSILLMGSNFLLLINGNWMQPYSLIALSNAFVALYFYYRQYKKGYNFNHGMWHFFSAIVCYFSILTFLN